VTSGFEMVVSLLSIGETELVGAVDAKEDVAISPSSLLVDMITEVVGSLFGRVVINSGTRLVVDSPGFEASETATDAEAIREVPPDMVVAVPSTVVTTVLDSVVVSSCKDVSTGTDVEAVVISTGVGVSIRIVVEATVIPADGVGVSEGATVGTVATVVMVIAVESTAGTVVAGSPVAKVMVASVEGASVVTTEIGVSVGTPVVALPAVVSAPDVIADVSMAIVAAVDWEEDGEEASSFALVTRGAGVLVVGSGPLCASTTLTAFASSGCHCQSANSD